MVLFLILIHFVNIATPIKSQKHGYNVRDLILENGEHYNAKIQRYYYPVCGHYSQTELTGQYENYCNFSNETKKKNDQLVFV